MRLTVTVAASSDAGGHSTVPCTITPRMSRYAVKVSATTQVLIFACCVASPFAPSTVTAIVAESKSTTRAGRASNPPSASTTQIAPVGPCAKNSASSSSAIETGPLLRGLDMSVGQTGGADLGERDTDE